MLLDLVEAVIDKQRDRTFPRGVDREVGGAEHVVGGAPEIPAQFVMVGRVSDLVDLGEPVALLVTQCLHRPHPDVRELGVDALVSCGFKWLCGPYAAGFTCRW